jgi:putative colanic acid biosynthesis UDP-glucose lipid carrier transferase
MSNGLENRLAGNMPLTTFTYVLADATAIIVASVLSIFVTSDAGSIPLQHRMAIMIAVLLTLIVFNAGGLYSSWRGRSYLDQARATTLGWLTVVSLLVLASYLAGPNFVTDRNLLLWWTSLGLVTLITVRLTAMFGMRALRSHGRNHKRVIVVGSNSWGQEVIERIQNAEWLGLDIVAVIDQRMQADGHRIAGVPLRGGFGNLLGVISEESVDEVWICLPLESLRAGGKDRIGEVMRILNDSTVTQRLLPEIGDLRLLDRPVTEIVGLGVVNLNTSPLHGVGRIAKGAIDFMLAFVISLIISPLILIIALAIKSESKGPVFFTQLRHGSNGVPFRMLKFRTMKPHAELDGTITQATIADLRISPLGAFLRRNSLDELPQFINVLMGHMSIVGPRPHAVEHNQYYRTQIDSYMQRHRVKPGITGWAQINGFRGATETIEKMRKRVDYDLYYIKHWSLWLDVKIIIRTIIHGFRSENAY